ncbi:DUF2147 domain-containing protein [Pseudoluteimonas lycopersici]|uniref:DUF2147 domain-containing protein n=1 Tax=Pseudoluteimonas lycopersici TaxID=1324796 RepID=A0A516V2D5_9GAMM|nr:DUF2147 domain-containing protein [Lysobacter lycopersici]QDQ72692.1 DUF2147 domain-containing protein [Lysobacter lycopersici]
MRSFVLLMFALLLPCGAYAQQASPIGQWRTIDDHSGKPRSIVEVYANADGSLSARILRLLDLSKGANPPCDACRGALHGRPVVGMVIAWGLHADDGGWSGGRILDPDNGKEYAVKFTPVDGGRKLEVRGYVGVPMVGRTQVWQRE